MHVSICDWRVDLPGAGAGETKSSGSLSSVVQRLASSHSAALVQPGLASPPGAHDGGYGECAKGCKLGPRCGDGKVQTDKGEACEDGNSKNGDGCSTACKNTVVK